MTALSDATPADALSTHIGKSDGLQILVVENHVSEAATLVRGLSRHGHRVDSVRTGAEALRLFGAVDLVLIDLELPDLDGLEVCRSIRAAGGVPMIAVTGLGSELDRVLGLQAGADDYLVKPYGFRELVARIEAVMRRAKPQTVPGDVENGQLRIDVGARQVSVDGTAVELTRKEFDLLYLLASRPGTVVTRKQVIAQVWGESYSRRTIDTHVSSVRGKLGGSDWILTVRGVGFRLGHG
jgi:DNA-binding response OmpR family regulator